MMGGYVQDQYPQGSDDADIFRIHHWHLIESFVYFSHNLVSLPPPGWTNIAHKNGVKVLGTLITEWAAGAALCREILHDDASATRFANQLVAMASYYRFDGWLINIENSLTAAEVLRLRNFLAVLTKAMHESVPGSLVVW